MLICAGQPAEICSITEPSAGHKKAYRAKAAQYRPCSDCGDDD